MKRFFSIGDIQLLQTLEQQIEPKITAVLVIDMQNDYIADDGKLGKRGMDVKRLQEGVPMMNRLIKEARKAGVMVIWIRHTHSLKDALPNYLVIEVEKIKGRPFSEKDFLAREGSWGAEYYEKMIKPLPSEVEVIKNKYGAFTNTNLDTYLQAKGIKTIIHIGCAIEVCVISTAIQGWHKGYYSILPPDCVVGFDQSLSEGLLKNYRKFFGYTPKAIEIMNIWKKMVA